MRFPSSLGADVNRSKGATRLKAMRNIPVGTT